jgi:hypothetical protein
MVDGRVVERPRGDHRFFKTQHFGLIVVSWLNGDRTGPGKGETTGQEGRVVVRGKSTPPRL